jgi:hypothetical protein
MPTTIEPLPHDAPLVDAPGLTISPVWYRYFSVVIVGRLQSSAQVTRAVTLPNQAASIGATALAQGSAGVSRVGWVLRITQPATTSSSVTVTIGYDDGGVAVSQAGAPVTGNTITTVQSGQVLVRSDAASPITYAVAYASVGATPMQYTLSVWIETVNG